MLIKLNKNMGEYVKPHGYELDPTQSYELLFLQEIESQISIIQAVNQHGLPALIDYQNWLKDNEIDMNQKPLMISNDLVSKYYGNKPLWKTDLSQGIVMKDLTDGDYYIVMECSRLNEGFKYTQILLTLGGCYD